MGYTPTSARWLKIMESSFRLENTKMVMCLPLSPKSDVWSHSTVRLSTIILIVTSILEGLLFARTVPATLWVVCHMATYCPIFPEEDTGVQWDAETLLLPPQRVRHWRCLQFGHSSVGCFAVFLGLVRCQHASQEAWQEGDPFPGGSKAEDGCHRAEGAADLLESVGKRKREQGVVLPGVRLWDCGCSLVSWT